MKTQYIIIAIIVVIVLYMVYANWSKPAATTTTGTSGMLPATGTQGQTFVANGITYTYTNGQWAKGSGASTTGEIMLL